MTLKTIGLVALIVFSGLMLGIIFSQSLPSINSTVGNPFQKIIGNPSSNELEVSVIPDPITIQPVTAASNLTQKSKKEQSEISIVYTNKTSSDLTGIEIWASGKGTNFGFSGANKATYDKDTKLNNIKYSIFKAQNVKKGQSGSVTLYLFSREQGIINLNIDVKTKEGKYSKTKSTKITAK